MSEKIKIKRPASHRWIIGISAFMTIGLAAFLSNIITGRAGGTFRQYWLILAVFSGFTLALFSLLLGI